MKNLLMALVMTTYCFSAYAGTQPAVAAQSQQNKMKTCNADPKAKILKGDERKAFMKDCLSAQPASGITCGRAGYNNLCRTA